MSYILDALRRADSERDRGSVPGLHTQAVPVGSGDAEAPSRSSTRAWLIAGAFVALLALVAWLGWGRSVPPGATALPPNPPPPVPMAAAPAPAPLVAPVAQPPAPVQTAPPTAAIAAAPIRAAASASAAPVFETAAAAVRKPATSVAAAAPRKTIPAAKAASAPVAAKPKAASEAPAKASEPEGRIYALNELPEEIRRGLPPVVIGGSIYSKSAANRMLVINGQVFHEGSELAPALTLDQIRLKSAVLKFKDYRYEIMY